MKAFGDALLDPMAAVPVGLIDPWGRPAPRRFDVYRNNVTAGLIRALEAGFPAVKSLVGDDFFKQTAVEFLRAHPPKSRIMMLYGEGFDDFLRGFAPAAQLGYLPDIARLEQSIRRSYHSADAASVDPNILANLSQDQFLSARLRFAPATFVQSSPWPILAIWRAALKNGPAPVMTAQDILILRPNFDPELHLLPVGAAFFLRALQGGQSVAGALEQNPMPEFDLAAVLEILVTGAAIIGVDYDQNI
jgi:hypothetical protein